MRIIPGTCSQCSAQVADLAMHKRWHDQLDAKLQAVQTDNHDD